MNPHLGEDMKLKKCFGLLVSILFVMITCNAFAEGAKILKTVRRPVIGKIVIDFDLASSGQSVFVVEAKTGQRIWINTLENLSKALKTFLVTAEKNQATVRLTGTVETWNDGNTVFADQKPIQFQVLK